MLSEISIFYHHVPLKKIKHVSDHLGHFFSAVLVLPHYSRKRFSAVKVITGFFLISFPTQKHKSPQALVVLYDKRLFIIPLFGPKVQMDPGPE